MTTSSSRSIRYLLTSIFALLSFSMPLFAHAIGGDLLPGETFRGTPTQVLQDAADARTQAQQAQTEQAQRDAIGYVATTTPLTPVKPELSVPIPGLTFSEAYNEGDDIVVPFLAQYISAVYRYMLGIATLVAIIVVIYGGFLYLLSASLPQVQNGKKLIQNAIGGLIVLYCSYLILWTVNPNLVHMQPLRLDRIRTVPIAENSGDDGDPVEGDGGGTSCRLRYNQGAGPWASLPYGPTSALMSTWTDARPTCSESSSGSSCIGTFQQSACGPTAVASVLNFYGLQVAVANRVPSPGPSMHPIDPIDVGILAIIRGYRIVGRGTTGEIARHVSENFPQFDSRSIPKTNTTAILDALRANHPLVISCSSVHLFTDDAATQPLASRRDGHTDLYRPGHYMVLSGAVNDQILRIHDVGNGRTKTIRMDEIQARCGALVEIKPKATYQETMTTTWGSSTDGVQVQMRLPANAGTGTAAGGGGQCRSTSASTAAAANTSARSGAVTPLAFTYQPEGQPASKWPAESARILYPSRLDSVTTPRVHVFIYLHGDNDGDLPPEQRYLRFLKPALEEVAGSKDVVIFTPHHNSAGDNYDGFDLNTFYTTALAKLDTVLHGVTVIDTVVGGHSGATCQGGPVITQAITAPTPNLRGVIAYDGCAAGAYQRDGQGLSPANFTPASGVATYINADLRGMGGNRVATASGGQLPRNEAIRSLWGNLTLQPCPQCAVSAGITACYAPNAQFQRDGGGELISFETSSGHADSVGVMTKTALCAFYRNNP